MLKEFSGIEQTYQEQLTTYYPEVIILPNAEEVDKFAADTFYRHVNIPPCQRYIPNGEASSPHEEAQIYEAVLKQHRPVDMAVLGIGPGHTCHIGFNEQGSTLDSRVRYVVLAKETYCLFKVINN